MAEFDKKYRIRIADHTFKSEKEKKMKCHTMALNLKLESKVSIKVIPMVSVVITV